MDARQQVFELRAEQFTVFDHGKVSPQVEGIVAQPAERFVAVEMNPHQCPAGLRRGTMAMPFTGADEEGIAGCEMLAMFARFEFAAPRDIQRQAELRQRAAFLPFEIKIRRIALRIWSAGADTFPTRVREIQRLVKQRFIDRQRVPERFREAHLLD